MHRLTLSRIARRLAAAAAFAGTLVLAGCATPALDTATSLQAVPPEKAFVLPDPGGPAIMSVTERPYANAVEQRIFLETDARTPGQNLFIVQLFGPVNWRTSGQTALRPGNLPPVDWRVEARDALPGIRLRESPFFVRNRYGPFGYAVGRGREGDLCMFAWQALSAAGSSRTLFRNSGSIQIRLRWCRMGASEESLLRPMYGFSINSFFRDMSWNPIGAPLEAEVSERGDVYPTGNLGFATVLPAEPPAPPREVRRPRRQRPAVAAAPAAPQPPAIPAPIGPVVPPPPGSARDTVSAQPPLNPVGTPKVKVPLPPA